MAPYSPSDTLQNLELVSAPIWVKLNGIPPEMFSNDAISCIARGIGEPIPNQKSPLDYSKIGEAKIKVEVFLSDNLPTETVAGDEAGNSVRFQASYLNLPFKCSICHRLGHANSRCNVSLPPQKKSKPASATSVSAQSVPASASAASLTPVSGEPPQPGADPSATTNPSTSSTETHSIVHETIQTTSTKPIEPGPLAIELINPGPPVETIIPSPSDEPTTSPSETPALPESIESTTTTSSSPLEPVPQPPSQPLPPPSSSTLHSNPPSQLLSLIPFSPPPLKHQSSNSIQIPPSDDEILATAQRILRSREGTTNQQSSSHLKPVIREENKSKLSYLDATSGDTKLAPALGRGGQ